MFRALAFFLLLLLPFKAFAKDVPEFRMWEVVRAEWGEAAADPRAIGARHEDVTCDGVDDYVISRMNWDSGEGPLFDILVVTNHGNETVPDTGEAQGEDSGVYYEAVSLPFTGASEQFGLCGSPPQAPRPKVEIEQWSADNLEYDFGIGGDVCPKAVAVVDGLCDSPRFFWQAGAAPGARLLFARH